MSSARYTQVKEIVVEALARAPEARPSYLANACGDDGALRHEVDSLLAHHGQDEDQLAAVIATGAAAALADAINSPGAESAGRRIGPYEIVGVLGEGGMGTVYHARQVEPLAREVALKLVKRGLDSARVLARFEAERQTMARLDHTGIARILDAGSADDGRPYFVMELVSGVPVTTYADERRLSVRERLALFLQVCQAVQHAHQKGILHRDLKPTNVLVLEEDGAARPKVIDFGIAKAIEPVADGGSLLTEAGHIIGTPDYMSPEQAGVRPGGADTRSDVYSLGVLLYELLTGQRPLRLGGLLVPEIQRLIASFEPARPSNAVSTSTAPDEEAAPDLAAIAAARHSSPSRLSRALAGDLDNILLKSLRKEPDRRYASVEQFAVDISRHLEGLPVLARPDTWTYRAGKFARRHRVAVAVAASLLVALVGFGGVMAVERDKARAAERRAAAEAATSARVSEFLVGLFNEADPYVSQGAPLSARGLLDRGADRIRQDLADQPEIEAALMATMSRAYNGLQVPDQAKRLAERALALERGRHAEPHEHIATALLMMAAAEATASNHDAAEPLYRRALAMRRAVLPPADRKMVEALSQTALELQTRAKFAEAEPLYREALAMARTSHAENSVEVTAALDNLGGMLHAQGRLDEARETLHTSLVRARESGAGPVLTSDIASELAVVLKNLERFEEAEPLYREALALRERAFGDHPRTAQSHNNLGVFLRGRGRLDDALQHLRLALDINRRVFGEANTDVGIAYSNLAVALQAANRSDEAEAAYRKSIGSIEASMGRDHWLYGQVRYNFGGFLRDRDQFAAAEPLMVSGHELIRKVLGPTNRRAVETARGLVAFYERWGRPQAGAPYRVPMADAAPRQ